MDFKNVWIYLRWVLAILLMIVIVLFAYPRVKDSIIGALGTEEEGGLVTFDPSGSLFDDGPQEPPEAEGDSEAIPVPTASVTETLAAPSGEVTAGSATPNADFHITWPVADIDAGQLSLSDNTNDMILLSFDMPPGNPSCVASMTLSMNVTEVTGPTELGVFPAAVENPSGILDNQGFEDTPIVSESSMSVFQVNETGQVTTDITAAYPGYFQNSLSASQPFVIAVKPTVPLASGGTLSFTASESGGEDVPTLTWSPLENCAGN